MKYNAARILVALLAAAALLLALYVVGVAIGAALVAAVALAALVFLGWTLLRRLFSQVRTPPT